MDETSIRLHQVVRAGHLTCVARAMKRSARSLTTNASTTQARGMFTLVAFICDDETIQNVLPQILLVNEKHLSKAEPAAALRPYLDAHSVLWTSSKAWVTSTLMCKIVRLLQDHLEPYQNECHFIFSSDGYRAHLTRPVWRAFSRARIMYHLIPAKMTWVMQPCDTHVFALLKDILRHECQLRALTSPNGSLSMTLLVQALARTIAVVLRGRSWRSSFWEVGLTGVQVALSERVLEKLELQGRPRISDSLPTLRELQCVFPARSILPIDDIFGWFTFVPAAHPPHAPVAAVPAADPAASRPGGPWAGRLRSSSSLALPEPQPADSSACPLPAMSSTDPIPAPAAPPPVVPRARRLLPWLPRRPPLPPAPPPP